MKIEVHPSWLEGIDVAEGGVGCFGSFLFVCFGFTHMFLNTKHDM